LFKNGGPIFPFSRNIEFKQRIEKFLLAESTIKGENFICRN